MSNEIVEKKAVLSEVEVEPDHAQQLLQKIAQFQKVVQKTLLKDVDYGVIPGTSGKPTLYKSGAEKIIRIFNCCDRYEVLDKTEDWQRPFFRYLVKCQLIGLHTGKVLSEGVGECNSMEAKYRYRWVREEDIPPELAKEELKYKETKKGERLYRIPNDEIYSQVNTILKMAKKRALVDAALSLGRLSAVFTQDLEDVIDVVPENGQGQKSKGQGQKETKPQRSKAKKDGDWYKLFLSAMASLKKAVGEETYYEVLGQYGFEHANQIKDKKTATAIYTELKKREEQQEEDIPELEGAAQ